MPTVVQCSCGRHLQLGDEHVGKHVRCSVCGFVFAVAARPKALAGGAAGSARTSPTSFLTCVARALVRQLGNLAGAVIQLPIAGDLLAGVWEEWSATTDDARRRAEVEAVARATAAETVAQIRQVLLDTAAGLPPSQYQLLEGYLHSVPATVRGALRRPTDPSGTTIPHGLLLRKAADLSPLLPLRLPRFQPGDRPPGAGDWKLVELLGVGGFGEVWKATNAHFDSITPVAIKFFTRREAKESLIKHEAGLLNRVLRQGRHEGIVRLEHSYLDADPPCLVYEYMPGGDLAGLIQEWHADGRPPTPERAGRVILRLAEIVAFTHRLQPPIVHRDLKPANILVQVRSDGGYTLKIADFGIGGLAVQEAIAQQQSTSRVNLQATELRGACTALYASPQQLAGAAPDPRDDVHALGVIWYQVITGDLSRGRPGGNAWQKRLAEKGMPPPLLGLLVSCMEEEPADRPADAGALAGQLTVLLRPEAPLAVPVPQHSGGGSPSVERPPLPSGNPPVALLVETYEGAQPPAPRYAPATLWSVGVGLALLLGLICWVALRPTSKTPPASLSEHDRAIEAATEAIRRNPKSATAYADRAEAYAKKEDNARAIRDLNEAIKLDPKLARAYALRGGCFAWQGDSDQALQDCEDAIKLDPNLPEAYRARALVYQLKQDIDRAIQDCNRALRLEPTYARAYVTRAGLYFKRDLDQALRDCNEAIRLDPKSSRAYHQRGLVHAQMGAIELAVRDWDEAIRLDPENAQAHLTRGIAYDMQRDRERALECFNRAINLGTLNKVQMQDAQARREAVSQGR